MDNMYLQKLRDLPIEGVAERLGLRVTRHKSLCPFHDDVHPSLSFNTRKNIYHCFVCGAKGGTIDLVMRHLGMDFLEACRWLANQNNIILEEYSPTITKEKTPHKEFCASRYEKFFIHPYLSDNAMRFLYFERMLDQRVVQWCRISSWQDNMGIDWLQIPYYDTEGKLIGIQNRNLSLGKDAPRFRFPQGSRCSIYNLPILNTLKAEDDLYLTEGCSDCWSMLSSGHKALAIPSATLLKEEDLKPLLEQHKKLDIRFHMFPDRDLPGERLFLQLKDLLPNLEHHHLPKDCKDFSEYYMKYFFAKKS
ncbi:MAG: CHC2 zinc finger domain-containing protein [Bacteroidales bacterium]|nr:CHC2 zinc finger domain-containing protein [Bacteroidales bacterium]